MKKTQELSLFSCFFFSVGCFYKLLAFEFIEFRFWTEKISRFNFPLGKLYFFLCVSTKLFYYLIFNCVYLIYCLFKLQMKTFYGNVIISVCGFWIAALSSALNLFILDIIWIHLKRKWTNQKVMYNKQLILFWYKIPISIWGNY